ncbi:carbohydrate ABC transporter permease [Alicyclobacillus ferrooxydans]|uniref:Sugar ABC transporter permease n=1 Tax=Alicyclobacillus ferrooxydans TaxID=471514 RepID=A0A0P9CFU4_9BACL|nr:sugar ABC transporter permease [Alicyclobacillus ferrooxydans]KPV44441.1 sugar ABC transporter permease [Alicyclobacillus ferrooxydans]
MNQSGQTTASESPVGVNKIRRPRVRVETLWAIFTLIPSIILLGVFVYYFIFWTGYVSFTKWNSFIQDMHFNGFRNYVAIFQSFRFQSDLRNMVFFTVFFMLGCLILGLFLAILVDQKIKAEGFFRSVFLYPMAISAAATGVIWSWLLNPTTGLNLILHAFGIKHVPQWYLSTRILPNVHIASISGGFPLAMIAVLIASIWQWSGFAMALYLAGLRAIPEELKEAARIDGAKAMRLFFSITLPQLRPITTTAVVMLMASSLKVFDLLYAMTGPGANFVTDLPALNMFDTTFQGNEFAQGAAIATVLLILVLIFIIPYLIGTLRKEVSK